MCSSAKYSKMTDFEINRKVLAITSGVKPLGYAHNADKRSAGVVKSNQYCWYDYCNSWAEAGPIIKKSKITISAPMEYDQPADWLAYPANDSDMLVSHPNPLRAAMVVFLMMQEVKGDTKCL